MPATVDPDPLTVLIDGRRYGGWMAPTITRSIEQCAATFQVSHTDRWEGQTTTWPPRPFDEVQILIGEDPVITGYMDVLSGNLGPQESTLSFAGRSRTADLVDCVTETPGGEFRGGTLAAIARALAGRFNVEVVEDASAGAPFPVQRIEPTDRAFSFLEELARMRGVLLTDDERGRLVITRAGQGRASGSLRQGINIQAARFNTNVSRRFSRYVVRTQTGIASSVLPYNAPPGAVLPPGGGVANAVVGAAVDPQVPRYRPMAVSAEGSTDNAGAMQRARWEAAARAGQSVEFTITVPGWRQPDKRLWRINERVPLYIPRWGIDEELLVISTTFRLDDTTGRVTELTLASPAGYEPEPLQARSSAGVMSFLAMLIPGSGAIPTIPTPTTPSQ